MQDYNTFLKLVASLEESVEQMKTAKTREELEALELQAKKHYNKLMTYSVKVQRDIHSFAMEQRARVVESDLGIDK